LSGFNVSQQLEKMKPRLDEIYAKNPEGRDTGIENTTCNLETYFQFMRQELGQPQSLSIPMIIYKAEKTDTGLTENPEFDWPCEKVTVEEIKESNHFTIFKKEDFINSIKEKINGLQPIISDAPLEKRLSNYIQKQRETSQVAANRKTLQLTVTLYLKPKTTTQLATQILDAQDNHGIIILCGEPGAGKSTSLKSLAYSSLDRKVIPVFIKLKEYYSASTLTEKLLRVGLNLQEIATNACKNLIFFLDGFDELEDKMAIKEIIDFIRPVGRIVISTRTHVYEKLAKELKDTIGPHIRYDINALIEEQIKSYFDTPDDYEFISQYPELLELCKNPLTLSLISEILPALKKENNLSTTINRYYIYKRFIQKLYYENEILIQHEHGIRPGFNLFQAFDYFNRLASLTTWNLKENVSLDPLMSAHYPHRAQLTENHETFVEYFISEIIFDEIKARSFYIIEKINFAEKISLIEFLCEKIQSLPEEEYINFIHTVITALQQPSHTACSANLATLLGKLEIPFSGLSFNDINFSGANVSGSIFHHARLKNANFKETTAVNLFMRNTECTGVDFNDTNFGEYPSYTHDKEITAFYPIHRDDTEFVFYAIAYEDKIELYQLGMEDDAGAFFTIHAPDDNEDADQEAITQLVMNHRDTPVYVKNKKIYFNTTEIYPADTDFNDDTEILHLRLTQNNDTPLEEQIEFYTHRSVYRYSIAQESVEKILDLPAFDEGIYTRFCLNPDLTKMACYTENTCAVFSIVNNSKIFEKKFNEDIIQADLISLKDGDGLCILFKNSEVIIINLTSKNILYNLKPQINLEHVKLSDSHKVMGSISHNYEWDWSAENYVPVESTLHFNVLPHLNQVIKNKSIHLTHSILHPQKPLLIHRSNNHVIEIQHLTTKQILQKFTALFEIIALDCFGDHIYILGPQQLIIWNFENGKTQEITFPENCWHDEYFTPPRFSFFSEKTFIIFDAHKFWYYNNTSQPMIEISNPNWVHFVSADRVILGHSLHSPINDDEAGEYTGICLQISEWNSHNLTLQEILSLETYACDVDESPLFELLNLQNNFLTIMGGGRRTIYRCNLSEKTHHEIGNLPGYDIQKISPTVFVCFSSGSQTSAERVAFYSIDETTEELTSFKPSFFQLSPEEDYENIALHFQWNHTLQLLMVYRTPNVSFWHIDLKNNFNATLVYDHRDALDLSDLNLNSVSIDALNDLLIDHANLAETQASLTEDTSFSVAKKISFTTAFSLPHFPTEIWLHILNYLSYSDRLFFSGVSQKCNAIANDPYLNNLYGPLLSSNDILLARKLITAYIKQLLINLMTYPLNESQPVEIKPSKVAPHLLTIGFFSGVKKLTVEYPVKYLNGLSY
ncbi:MAG: pentapeptide repeat-containing protein, partial [Gammaproteobacteria bacterium]|nr:pentapeptide repeat-containing protein [Gammaproteobacteria bacterium]